MAIDSEMIQEQTLGTSLVEVCRRLLEQRVDSKFELELLELE